MDILRPSQALRRRIRLVAYGGVGLAIALSTTMALSRLKPAAPSVDRALVWIDQVKRGSMVRQVRGPGTLVPEDMRWIPASTTGRVERILIRPGTHVTSESVILELSNPPLGQELQDAELKLDAADARLANMRVQVEDAVLQQEALAASISADYRKARMQAEMNEALAKHELVSALALKQSEVDTEQLAIRNEIAQKQLASASRSVRSRLAVQESEVAQARAVLTLKRHEVEALTVRAGFAGVLQLVLVDVGQQVAPGANLARIADPSHLKAELKIAETQAKDIQIGQPASIDTRNGVAEGRVARIAPSVQSGTVTVDVALNGPLPKGARPDLSVDGTIELERLPDVIHVGRPAFGREQSTVGLFKLDPDGAGATRVQVELGRSSVDVIEVLHGLGIGDGVILSDMSAWDQFDRIRLR
jgi:HlyD family secretion protein